MENKAYKLNINSYREKGTTLAAPRSGLMNGRIDESMNAKINVKLFNKKTKQIILEDIGYSAGIEVAEEYKLLVK